ncbi:helix-turn-helix transcriptional regulator [Bacillaceae bacterium Marseille-Q3522]|nr:helix-turn-helix transcriptional regulator [Bacillaceae bacterium Marseille-Q3522]
MNELKELSLYTSLKRLEKGALIQSYWGDESQRRWRKYYKVKLPSEGVFRRTGRTCADVATGRLRS